jgi:hypothetical protein
MWRCAENIGALMNDDTTQGMIVPGAWNAQLSVVAVAFTLRRGKGQAT